MNNKVKFYRGLRIHYDSVLHTDGIYFAEDTNELLMNGSSYGCMIFPSGPSIDRPKQPVGGFMYFDNTLNMPIWYSIALGWVNSNGTPIDNKKQITYNNRMVSYNNKIITY